jgi:hypothetical protein
MVAVLVKVQGQVDPADDFLFEHPRLVAHRPTDEGILLHPVRESRLAVRESHTVAAADSAQLNLQSLGKQTPEGQTKRRTLSVSLHVIANPAA